MSGKNVKSVKLDTEGLVDEEYSCKRWIKWTEDIEEAIRKDLKDEGKDLHTYGFDFRFIYGQAADEVICDLLFKLKWAEFKIRELENADKVKSKG